jgi:uncharacterized protein
VNGSERWKPWFGPVALLGGLIIAVVGGAVVVLVAQGGAGAQTTQLSPGETDVATLIQDLAFVGVAVALARTVGPVSPAQFGLRLPRARWRAVGLVVAGLVAFFVISAAWLAILHVNGEENQLIKDIGGYGGTLDILAACAVTTVLAPICEETLFRGLMFRSLSNWRGPWPAALITGALFGAVHGLSAPLADLVPLAFLGVLLCGIYQWTGSLYPCIALHVLNNSISLGADEHWRWRAVELVVGALVAVAVVLWLVRLASARWPATPATD